MLKRSFWLLVIIQILFVHQAAADAAGGGNGGNSKSGNGEGTGYQRGDPFPFIDNTELYQTCKSDYPNMKIAAVFTKPYTGIYVGYIPEKPEEAKEPKYQRFYFVYQEAPAGIEYQPRIVRRPRNVENNLSDIVLTEKDILFTKNEKFHILQASTNTLYSFETLGGATEVESMPELFQQKKPKAIFWMQVDRKNRYTALVYNESEEYYLALYEDETFQEFAKIKLEQDQDKLENVKMAVYSNLPNGDTKLGIISYQNIHRPFKLKLINNGIELDIGPYQDNQAILGCPQTFCFAASVDGIDWDQREGKIVIFQRNYYWTVENFDTNFQNVKRLSSIDTSDDFYPYLIPPIDAAAQADNFYLMRGSRIYFKPMNPNVTTYIYLKATRLFNQTKESWWYQGIDAAMGVPGKKDSLVVFGNDTYKIANLVGSNYLIEKEGHISEFLGYPDHIEGTLYYPEKQSIYAFSANWVYIHDVSSSQELPPKTEAETKYFQDLFGTCAKYDYGKTIYSDLTKFRDLNQGFSPYKAVLQKDYSWIYVLVWVCFAVALILALVATMIYIRIISRKKEKITDATGVDVEPHGLISKKSGFSVTKSLKEVVDQRAALRKGLLSYSISASGQKAAVTTKTKAKQLQF